MRLTRVIEKKLTFSWNAVRSSCSAVVYTINSEPGCGICPNSSTFNTIDCVDYNITNEQSCSFVVQTVVCDDDVSSASNILTLRGTYNFMTLYMYMCKSLHACMNSHACMHHRYWHSWMWV